MKKAFVENDVLTFGKFKGKNIDNVIADDVSYILWACESIDGFSKSLTKEQRKRIKEVHYEEYLSWDNYDYDRTVRYLYPKEVKEEIVRSWTGADLKIATFEDGSTKEEVYRLNTGDDEDY